MGYKLKMAGISVALAAAFAIGTGVGSVYIPQPQPNPARYVDLADHHTAAQIVGLCMVAYQDHVHWSGPLPAVCGPAANFVKYVPEELQ